jgi:hypothetical protein
LWRYEDSRWAVTIDADRAADMPVTDVTDLAERAEAAAVAAGLRVVQRQLGAPPRAALTRRLFVLLRGELDQAGLADLRRELGISGRGDLADDREWDFGERALNAPGADAVVLRLTRLRPGAWAVAVEAEPTAAVDPADLDRWAAAVSVAARANGLDPAAPAR